MQITPQKTRTLVPPQDDFFEALSATLAEIPERSIIALSSKAVAIEEGRCVEIPPGTDVRSLKERLAEEDADWFVRRRAGEHRHFTMTRGSLIGSAGIDESNGNGHLVLWPRDPMASARTLRERLKERYGVQELGVLVIDSHSIPLHNGATGFAIGYAGFLPLKDYRNEHDLFGRPFKVERQSIADGLAAGAAVAMGEGDESTPAALIADVPFVTFTDAIPEDPYLTLTVPLEEDYFRTFLRALPWEQGGGGVSL